MSDIETKSNRRELRFWGWGYVDEDLSSTEKASIDNLAKLAIGPEAILAEEPQVEDFDLPVPRISMPEALAGICSSSSYDRLVHTYGKSFADSARMLMREASSAPDVVAFPETEDEITEILSFASENNIAVIPFGGGTSVCGGVEAAVGAGYDGTICMDMQRFDRILEIDEVSRTARIQGGMLGPDIDAALKPHGLTLRHFPQSYQFSTIGGWVATRAGGHFATLYTHIDDLVESVRMVTPNGTIETRRLPGSGAGPSPDRMMIGSEGILGIITEVSVRLQSLPIWKATASVTFEKFEDAAEAVRVISQSGLFPTNCRLLDHAEALGNGVVTEPLAVLVLGFESSDHPVQELMERALTLAELKNGKIDHDSVVYRERKERETTPAENKKTEAEIWKNAFFRAPYLKNRMMQYGLIADTFETSMTWERLPDFYKGITSDIATAIKEITGRNGRVSCRFTHVYPDGPSVYITFGAVGTKEANFGELLEKWCKIKQVANEKVIARGGTITHHHAVGRDHRSGYEKQMPSLFLRALSTAKASLDPQGILNPGVLIDPEDREVGITGAMEGYSQPLG